jgi:hypothetical protein
VPIKSINGVFYFLVMCQGFRSYFMANDDGEWHSIVILLDCRIYDGPRFTSFPSIFDFDV